MTEETTAAGEMAVEGTARPVAKGSAHRVREYLEERGLAEHIFHFEQSTKTAQMAADVMGCQLGQIVKSLVFTVGDEVVLALVAGDKRGDSKAIAAAVGGGKARFADADKVREATGYAIGGVSPFDLPVGLTVLIDESLNRFSTVYPAAGTPSSMVRMSYEQLLEICPGEVCSISH